MKFLIVDTGVGLPVVQDLVREGHKVVYWINWIRPHPRAEEVMYGEGLLERWGVERVDNFLSYIDSVDCIVFVDVGFGMDADFLRGKGYVVFSGGRDGEELEQSRRFGKEVCERYGIKVPESNFFDSIDEARRYIESRGGGRFAIKVSTVGDSSIKTYISRSVVDALAHLDWVEEKVGDVELVIEDVVDGVEMAVSAFFNGERFLMPVCNNFEHKRLMPGDVGEMTGEMGTVLYWTRRDLKLFEETLKKLEGFLREIGYRGIIDVNCIVNEEGAFVLEFTSRFGYPTVAIMSCLMEGKLGEVIYNVASGVNKDIEGFDEERFAVGVCLDLPGYLEDSLDVEVISLSGDSLEEMFGFVKCMALWYDEEEGKYFSVPGNSRLLTVVGVGDYLGDAIAGAYDNVRKVYFKDMRYRNDIGKRVMDSADKLLDWGYISEGTWSRMI